MGALEELASYADVEGLDWPTLNAAGHGILGDGGYIDALDAKWQKFYAVAQTLAISDAEWEETTAKDARDAWTEVRDHIKKRARAMLDALEAGELMVAWDRAVTIYTGSLKKLIIAASAISHRNMTAQEDGTVVFAVQTGQTTLEEAQSDADHIAMLWDAVVRLDQWGALGDIKKQQFAGLGQPGAGAIVARGLPIAIAAIGIAAVIAGIIVFLSYLSHRNELLDKYCFDEAGNLRANAPMWCEAAGESLTTDPLTVFLEPLQQTGKRLATGVSIAIGVAMVLWVAPRALRRARAA